MALFQKSVLKNHLKTVNSNAFQKAWDKYQAHFHNPVIQENIRNSKEEQYQEGFLEDLFVKILGYVKNPSPKFNLTTELKNMGNAQKTDGAILKNKKAIAVIELKGTDTTHLGKVETQAFGYKSHHPNCDYVIISNFEKLRFYIDNAVDFVEFNLFELKKEDFKLLWLCLQAKNLLKNLPQKIKHESLVREETITQKLYKDYATFRAKLFADIQARNPKYDKLTLFNKTQKLLDRFLFIFFAEDRGLLKANTISHIIMEHDMITQKLGMNLSLYDRFKEYFNRLDTGFKNEDMDIFAYNGGLFAPDALLDSIQIDDLILRKYTYDLSVYDFESDVSVNILGHIFEHSLTEIEEIQAQLSSLAPKRGTKNSLSKQHTTSGQTPLPRQSKRKKDGVFYTPKYITKYMVENTVGKLCQEQKDLLGIQEEAYEQEHKGRKKATLQKLQDKLKQYRAWLLQITICDPACGSGAFLNQALEFLIAEHQYIDALEAKLFGSSLVLTEVENAILEHNLFGVDINKESVEIAKLSLWLRTAKRGRKLTTLNDNLKVGNSLIDDPKVAGEKAFDWKKEFPQIFPKKEKEAFHITTATHDSRTSQRMIDHKVRERRDKGKRPKANPIWLEAEDEILISEVIAQIVKEDDLNVMAYNICGDHIHLLLVCEQKELTKIVGKIKAKTARAYNLKHSKTITRGHIPLPEEKNTSSKEQQTRGHVPLPEGKVKKISTALWTQKFGSKKIDSEEQLWNTIDYIQKNRLKHELPENKDLQTLVQEICCTDDYAFRTEYKGGFDVVIRNPPYGAKLAKEVQQYLNKKYIQGASETVIAFIKLAYDNLMHQKSTFGFIIPKSFNFASNYKSIREYVFADIREIVDCKKIWKEVKLEQVMFFFEKKVKTDKYLSRKIDNQTFDSDVEIDKKYIHNFGFFLNGISDKELDIAFKMLSHQLFIKNIAENSRGGMFQKHIEEVAKARGHGSLLQAGYYPVLGGAEIQRQGIVDIKGIVKKKFIEGDSKSFIKENSILVQNIVAHIQNPTDHIKITATYPTTQKYAIVDTINQLTFQPSYDAKVFWLLFNSKLINWYAYRFIFAKAIRTMHFDNSITNRIPVPQKMNQKPFIKKARGHIPLSAQSEWRDFFLEEQSKAQNLVSEITQTDQEIDTMVYKLYGLSEAEIKIVENS